MSFDRIADRKIREAMSEGKFDRIARDGKIDLEDYFKVPAEMRMAYSVLKSANLVPEEVELLRDVDRLEEALRAATNPPEREARRNELTNARLKLDLALERNRRRMSRSLVPDP